MSDPESFITTDRSDPRLHEVDERTGQNKAYLVLSEEERRKGYVRPVRRIYKHTACGTTTTMGVEIAQTYARDPAFYSHTWCMRCQQHLPVDQFVWLGPDGYPTSEKVGS